MHTRGKYSHIMTVILNLIIYIHIFISTFYIYTTDGGLRLPNLLVIRKIESNDDRDTDSTYIYIYKSPFYIYTHIHSDRNMHARGKYSHIMTVPPEKLLGGGF